MYDVIIGDKKYEKLSDLPNLESYKNISSIIIIRYLSGTDIH